MERRILVIDTTDNKESIVIKALVHAPIQQQRSSGDELQDFIEFNPCKHGDCVYLFTQAVVLNGVTLNKKSQHFNRMVEKQLGDYFLIGIHLVLYITTNDTWNMRAYDNFRSIDYELFNKKIPALCIVNDTHNAKIHKYIQNYPNILLDMKSYRDHSASISIQHLWESIEELSLPPSIEQNGIDCKNEKFDANADDRSRVNTSRKQNHESRTTQRVDLSSQQDDFFYESKPNVVRGMFNEKNTSIEKLLGRCEKYQARDYKFNCVLLTTGSLNPIHRSHINNLDLVKRYLEQSKPRWNVLAGYLSPTHDSYVRSKLGKATIPGHDRCDLCELAIREHEHETQDSPWLHVSRAECEYRHGFVDFGPTTEALCQYLNSLLVVSKRFLKQPLHVVYVCGLDHFNKCSDVRRLATEKYIKCAVIYRKNADEQNVSKLNESSNIIYVPLADERSDIIDISSTEIRRCWANMSPELTQLTYASVIDRLKEMNFRF